VYTQEELEEQEWLDGAHNKTMELKHEYEWLERQECEMLHYLRKKIERQEVSSDKMQSERSINSSKNFKQRSERYIEER